MIRWFNRFRAPKDPVDNSLYGRVPADDNSEDNASEEEHNSLYGRVPADDNSEDNTSEEEYNSEFEEKIKRLHEIVSKQNKRKQKKLADYKEFFSDLYSFRKPCLPLLSVVPFDIIPDNIKGHDLMEKYFLEEARKSDLVKVSFGFDQHGTCDDTLTYFNSVLFDGRSGEFGKHTRIYVDNALVGVLKHEGNPIMMALETEKNKAGAYPLVAGGLYTLSGKQESLCEKVFKADRKWSKYNFSSLTVRPMGMLYEDISDQTELSKEILPRLHEFLQKVS